MNDVNRRDSVEFECMGGAGGGDVDDFDEVIDAHVPEAGGDVNADDVVRCETGVVTGITTGFDTDDVSGCPEVP